ncbi:MAG: zinc ABC transporter substrate-binding protein [Acidobacteria bacterium]|nr:zinc ABC transporter substrate-binding protein [Acidobacteriota bacterium]
MKQMLTLVTLVGILPLVGWAGAGDRDVDFLIVCSTTQVTDFARQVAGDRVRVHGILAPGEDPHTYMPKPADARMVAEADLCLQNGLNLEGKNWMATLAEDAGKPVVTCTDGVQLLELEEEGRRVPDPHAWFSPRNAAVYVRNILTALNVLDPAGEAEYRARAALYLQQLRVLDAWIRQQFNTIPPAGRILVTSHDAFNYFAEEYGFENRAPVGWSTGRDVGGGMSPERRKLVIESIRESGISAIFVETSVNPKLLREIAREAGVAIGGELYSDSMGPRDSAGETYLGMMRENTLTIIQALAPVGEARR